MHLPVLICLKTVTLTHPSIHFQEPLLPELRVFGGLLEPDPAVTVQRQGGRPRQVASSSLGRIEKLTTIRTHTYGLFRVSHSLHMHVFVL